MLSNIRNLLLAALLGCLLGLLAAWYLTSSYKDATWGERMAKAESEASQQLSAAITKVLAAERRATDIQTESEKQYVESSKEIERVLADNRRLSRILGGLRDPGTGGSSSAAGGGSSCPAGSSTSGRLSAEASDFLLEFAAEADRAARYAQLCHSWATQLNDSTTAGVPP